MAVGTGAAILGSAVLGAGSAAVSKPKSAKDPNAYLRPYMQGAANDALAQYRSGGPQLWDRSTVAGMSDATSGALQGIVNRAQNGSPLIDQAQGVVSQGLQQPIQSQFGQQQNPYATAVTPQQVSAGTAANPFATSANPFGGASNPYLDATFDQAAQKSRSVLDSEFARGGRNISASAPARADMLSSLAAQIYAPAYEAERNRQAGYAQQQLGIGANSWDASQAQGLQAQLANQSAGLQSSLAGQQIGAQGFENSQNRQLSDLASQRSYQQSLLGYASPLAAQDYNDLQQQLGAGGMYDQYAQAQLSDQVSRYNQQATSGQTNLNNYLAQLQGLAGSGGPPIQPAASPNYLSAGLGGALLGSSLFGSQPQQSSYMPYAGGGGGLSSDQALALSLGGLW